MTPTTLTLVLTAGAVMAADDSWKQSLQTALQHHQSGDLCAACPHYGDALQGNPELKRHPGVLTNWGLALQAEKRAEEAVGAFQAVIELQPADANSYFNVGNAHLDAAQHEEAIGAFRKCLALSPTDSEAYYEMGLAMLQQKKEEGASNDEAVEALLQSVSLKRDDPKAWVALGDGRATQQRWEESESAYREACALRPGHGPSWSNLGNALEELGRNGEAESSWRAAVACEPFDGLSGCLQNLGAMLRRTDRMPESRSAYASALQVDPKSAEAYMGLGRCGVPAQGSGGVSGDAAFGREYVDFLARTYGNAIKLEPENAGAYVAVGEGMRMFGLQGGAEAFGGDGALEMYQHALNLMPGNTCAKTHVAFGKRAPASAEVTTRLMTGEGAEEEEGEGGEAAAALATDSAAAEPPSVESLSAPTPVKSAAAISAALSLWRENGVAIFPSLLSAKATDALLQRVRDAQEGNHTRDYTKVTRDKGHRCHKALPVREAEPALKEIAASLAPFFEAALGCKELSLLESGFMVTGPGAAAQSFHRDVAPAVVSRSSMTVSVQISLVDTATNQGCFEVIPKSQAYDAKVSDRTRIDTMPKVKVGAPKGTVTVYALHTMHRGSANTHDKDRPFFFFTLMGDGLPPPGLAYTMQPEDIGKWRMTGSGKLRK